MSRREKNPLPISPWAILLVLVICGVIVWQLLPGKRAVVERLMKDANYDRALTTLREMPVYEKARDREFYELTEIQLERRLLTSEKQAEALALLSKIAEVAQKNSQSHEYTVEVKEVLKLIQDPEQAHQALDKYLPGMSLPIQRGLYDEMVASALALNKPEVAAAIYENFWKRAAVQDNATQEMVRLWRFSQQPAKALAAIDTWQQQSGANTFSPTLARLRIDLLRELGQPEAAYVATRALSAKLDKTGRDQLYEVLVATALESGKTVEVLPEIHAYAEAHPQDAKVWQQYVELAITAGQNTNAIAAYEHLLTLRAKSTADLFRLAQLHEWSNQPGRSFDYYLEALRLKQYDALPRLLDLNAGLYRDEELAAVLAEAPEVEALQAFADAIARLQARTGNFEAAQKSYEQAIRRKPTDFVLVNEYASFEAAMFEFEKAAKLYEQALKLRPEDVNTRKALAEVYLLLGDYDAALALYEKLAEDTKDELVMNRYVTLAESLGKIDNVRRGLRRKIEVAAGAVPQDYMRLAYFENMATQRAEYLRVLQDGVKRFPNDPALRLQTAYALASENEYGSAVELLAAHPDLRTSPEVIQFYLTLLIQTQRIQEARAFLRSEIKPELLETPALLGLRAQVAEVDEQLDEASAIYARLHQAQPQDLEYGMNHARLLAARGKTAEAKQVLALYEDDPNPEILKLSAMVYNAAGDYRTAEKYQKRYLETRPKELPQSWGFLGDILLSRGDKLNARRAYQRGLNEMLADIARQAKP